MIRLIRRLRVRPLVVGGEWPEVPAWPGVRSGAGGWGALPGAAMVGAALLGLIVQLSVASPAAGGQRSEAESRSTYFEVTAGRSFGDHGRRGGDRGHVGVTFGIEQQHLTRSDPPWHPRQGYHRRPVESAPPITHPTPRYEPAPRYEHHDPSPGHRRYEPRHEPRYEPRYKPRYEPRCETPRGRWETRWCPPVYRTFRDPCGTVRRVCVRPGRYERVWVEIRVGTSW